MSPWWGLIWPIGSVVIWGFVPAVNAYRDAADLEELDWMEDETKSFLIIVGAAFWPVIFPVAGMIWGAKQCLHALGTHVRLKRERKLAAQRFAALSPEEMADRMLEGKL